MLKRDELISVIVPVHNAEKTLEGCLRSIAGQEGVEWEILLVDDGSTDESAAICRAFAEKDGRIRFFRKENGGVSTARNLGIDNARGSWIAFADSDDELAPGMLAELLSAASGNEDVICCGCTVVGEDERPVGTDRFLPGDRLLTGAEKTVLFRQLVKPYGDPSVCAYIDIGVPWGKLYRTSLIRENGIRFDELLLRHQDNIFNIHAFYHAGAVRYVDRPMYRYRIGHYSRRHLNLSAQNEERFFNEQYRILKEYGLLAEPSVAQAAREAGVLHFLKIEFQARQQDLRTYLETVGRLRDTEAFRYVFHSFVPAVRPYLPAKEWNKCVLCRLRLHPFLYLKYHAVGKARSRKERHSRQKNDG